MDVFTQDEKERFRKLMRAVEEFSGVQILPLRTRVDKIDATLETIFCRNPNGFRYGVCILFSVSPRLQPYSAGGGSSHRKIQHITPAICGVRYQGGIGSYCMCPLDGESGDNLPAVCRVTD